MIVAFQEILLILLFQLFRLLSQLPYQILDILCDVDVDLALWFNHLYFLFFIFHNFILPYDVLSMRKPFNFCQNLAVDIGWFADSSDNLLHDLQLSALWSYYLAPFLYDLALTLLELSIHADRCISEGKKLRPIFAVLVRYQCMLVVCAWFYLFQEIAVGSIDLLHQSCVGHRFFYNPNNCHLFPDLDLALGGSARRASSLERWRRS